MILVLCIPPPLQPFFRHTHSSEVTYVGRSTAAQPSDGINEVLLHLRTETYTGHQLLQQLAVLQLKEGRQHVGSNAEKLVKAKGHVQTLKLLSEMQRKN